MNGLRNLFPDDGIHSYKWSPSFCEYLQDTGLYDFEDEIIQNFDSLVDEIKDWVTNKGFKQAEVLMDLVLDLKDEKVRADGKTPSALHEMTQAVWFISLVEDDLPIQDVEGVLSAIFAHDIGEDFGYLPDDMEDHLLKNGIPRGGKLQQFKEDFDLISKAYGEDGEARHENNYQYYQGIHTSPNATIAKMLDRAHNLMTLVNVKDVPKMNSYIASTLQLQDYFMDKYETAANDKDAATHPQLETYRAAAHLIEKEIKVSRFFTANSGVPLPGDDELQTAMPQKGFKNLPVGLHPMIVPAERIRLAHPETHLENDPVRYSSDEASGEFYHEGDKDEPEV